MLCENFRYPKLMRYFEEISAIPRGSYHEEGIAAYLVDFAKARGLRVHTDSARNVLIDLPATEGYEHEPALLLQGHTDMVCEKNEGVDHDFLKDPLKLYVKDGWIRAEGTTLGADNGVAVAAMLAILDGATDAHPALQCLFTASEEVGLDGAQAFDYSKIYARMMLNMDGAEEEMITAGCAGGVRTDLYLPVDESVCEGPCLRIRLSGLAGGHSGEDIHRGRANANKLMGRILLRLWDRTSDLRLISVHGGSKDNAIPREAEAILTLSDLGVAEQELTAIRKEICGELCADDNGFSMVWESVAEPNKALTREATGRIVFLMATVANGVLAMHRDLKDLVGYSRNLGVVSVDTTEARITFSSRSGMESQLEQSMAELESYARLFEGTFVHRGRYPGWDFSEESTIRRRYIDAYRSLFGRELQVELIHAGLECGIIKQAIPDMDLLSCAATVKNLHSPDEALNVESFARFFGTVLKVLEQKQA